MTNTVLVIDNFDSFTYNLINLLECQGAHTVVYTNTDITVEKAQTMPLLGILISPGPSRPETSGVCIEMVEKLQYTIPILGVCLGHQILALVNGAQIVHAIKPMHGKLSTISHNAKGIFRNLPNSFKVMRYHSLVVLEDTLPAEMEVTARTADNEIMALKHKKALWESVQFHPEALLSEYGKEIIENWITNCQEYHARTSH